MASTPSLHEPRSSDRPWWPGALAVAVWAAQGLAGWFLASHACTAANAVKPPLVVPEARPILIALSVAALAAAAFAGARAGTRWQSSAADERLGERRERVAFVSFAGWFLSLMLGMGLILATLPAVWLAFCGTTR